MTNVSEHVVPVAPRLPVGRLEWAEVGPFLYGVDAVGQVFKISTVTEHAEARGVLAFLARFARQVLR